jgi:hypothetical protein
MQHLPCEPEEVWRSARSAGAATARDDHPRPITCEFEMNEAPRRSTPEGAVALDSSDSDAHGHRRVGTGHGQFHLLTNAEAVAVGAFDRLRRSKEFRQQAHGKKTNTMMLVTRKRFTAVAAAAVLAIIPSQLVADGSCQVIENQITDVGSRLHRDTDVLSLSASLGPDASKAIVDAFRPPSAAVMNPVATPVVVGAWIPSWGLDVPLRPLDGRTARSSGGSWTTSRTARRARRRTRAGCPAGSPDGSGAGSRPLRHRVRRQEGTCGLKRAASWRYPGGAAGLLGCGPHFRSAPRPHGPRTPRAGTSLAGSRIGSVGWHVRSPALGFRSETPPKAQSDCRLRS